MPDVQSPVLVTGSAGRLGRATVAALTAAGWPARGFDLQPTPGISDFVVGDLTDFSRVQQAARGARALIHLGATPDDDDFVTRLLPANVIGVHNVLEAARLSGIQRIVLASTGQVNWWQQAGGPWPVRVQDEITPRHWYAATKVFLESIGRSYARNFGMSIVAVRLGWCPRTAEQVAEIGALKHGPDIYLSPGDAGRFFTRAVQADIPPGFHLVFASSLPVRDTVFDPVPARRILGYEAAEQWPTGATDGIRP